MLLSNLDVLATAPGGVARLRELILTLAVQGKLVPQDPADEPASVLLLKIRAEKDRLIAEGKIKRDKPLAEIAEEDKPFELPVGWEWVRALDICALITDGDHQAPPKADSGVPFLVIGDVRTGVVLLEGASRFVPDSYFEELDWGKKPFLGDVLYTTVGSFGIPVPVVQQQRFCFQRHIALFRPAVVELQSYLALALRTTLAFRQAEKGATGTAQKTVPLSVLRDLRLPLPPLAEQSRIVTSVEELMHLCDALQAKGQLEATQHAQLVSTLLGTLTASTTPEELADNWQRVAQHFDLLLDRPEAIDALEQTLLQLAVRGLLVPQDPTDEPASALLQKIRAEKDRLIATGQIKRDKPLPPITDEERPFELPVGWEWVRLVDVALRGPSNGLSPRPQELPTDVRCLSLSATTQGFFKPEYFKYVDVSPQAVQQFFLKNGDLLLQRGNSLEYVGIAAIYDGPDDAYIYPDLMMRLQLSECVKTEFVHTMLVSAEGRSYFQRNATGTQGTMPKVNQATVAGAPIPLPPIAEQSRIVTRVTALRRLCADLRQRLADAQTIQSHLAQALVESTASV